MEAKDLWLKRQEVMEYEDEQTELREEIDKYKNSLLEHEEKLHALIDEHNTIAAEFEKEVAEATQHLTEKLDDIGERKKEIREYSNNILLNDEKYSELTENYNKTKDKWKSAITKYTVGLDKFVDSGEVKDV